LKTQDQNTAELNLQISAISNECNQLKQRQIDHPALLEKATRKGAKLEEENKRLKRKVDRFSKQKQYSYLEAELRDVKKQLYCPVCKDTRRDCAIIKCGHVFCKSCIKTNLATRHRKCPGCGLAFGNGDVVNIFIE